MYLILVSFNRRTQYEFGKKSSYEQLGTNNER